MPGVFMYTGKSAPLPYCNIVLLHHLTWLKCPMLPKTLVLVFSPQKQPPWLSRALHCIGKAILADKADAASRHFEHQQLPDSGSLCEGGSRRRSSAVRAVALFQKFKDYNEGGDGKVYSTRVLGFTDSGKEKCSISFIWL